MINFLESLDGIPESVKGGAIAIGNFDGVHRGHRKLLDQLQRLARDVQGPAVALTFFPSPATLLRPESAPKPLTWITRRAEMLQRMGADFVIAYPTSRALLELEPEAFFADILQSQLKIRAIAEGPNFRFGKGRRGDVQLLERLCSDAHIQFHCVTPEVDAAQMVSSSQIRELIANGDIDRANRLLVEPYQMQGVVGRGAGRGRTIGIPTANLEAIEVLVPGHGVYAGRAWYSGKSWHAAIHIGPNPTFAEDQPKVEIHLLNFHGDLYDQTLKVELLSRLRAVQKFESKDALLAQLHQDLQRASDVCNEYELSNPR